MNTSKQPEQEILQGKMDRLKPVDRERLLEEISRLSAETSDLREKRIDLEDEILVHSPEQRKNNVLDYIRRGYLRDVSIYIMPEIIQTMPALLDSELIDFSSPEYDEKLTIERILRVCREIEKEVTEEDRIIRSFFQDRFKLTMKTQQYLNAAWYRSQFIGPLNDYRKKVNTKIHEKNPFYGRPEEYKADLRKQTMEKMGKIFSGDMESVLTSYELEPEKFNLSVPERKTEDGVKHFLLSKSKEGFVRYPRREEYTGPKVENPPSLKNQRIPKGILIVERDQVPAFEGGVILDGNFGYDKNGNIVYPSDKIMIDHHDKLDQEKYDTASIMVGRFWRDEKRFGSLSAKEGITIKKLRALDGFRTETGEKQEGRKGTRTLLTMVNHLDSDSILSLWAFRNPKRAAQYKSMIDKISHCGDFLTGSGVMKYGATARDYEYIIRNYLRACQETIQNERVEEDFKKLAEEENALQTLISEKQSLENELKALFEHDEELVALDTTLSEIKKSQMPPNEKGKAISAKTKERDALITKKYGERSVRLKELEKRQKQRGEEIKKARRELDDKRGKKISTEETAKITAHMLEVIEDILTNPFKYQRFFLEEREKENRTIDQISAWYRNGDVEIMSYSEDPEMILLMGLKMKEFPGVECIDGQYFFLRKREDFNQPIVITVGQNEYMVGINTQDARIFDKYDFNDLIDRLRSYEDEIAHELLIQKETELNGLPLDPPKGRENLKKEIAGIRANIEKNNSGKNWRNRTQLIFCFKSYIPQEKFLEMVRQWKGEQDAKFEQRKKQKR